MIQGNNGAFIPERFFPELQTIIDKSGLINGRVDAAWHHHAVPHVKVLLGAPDDSDRPGCPRVPFHPIQLHDFLQAELNRLLRHLQYDFAEILIPVLHKKSWKFGLR